MARSSYIYVLYQFCVGPDKLVGVFTVLHEMQSWVDRNTGRYYAERHRDGHPDIPPTAVALKQKSPQPNKGKGA